MTTITVDNPFPYFTDAEGNALESGNIYIGVAGTDAKANPITVYWDDAKTVTASQPIRTIGGYPDNGGSPSNFFTGSDFSITIENEADVLIFSKLRMNANELALFELAEVGVYEIYDTVADLQASTESARGVGVTWEAQGFRYLEADPGAVDEHLTTAGGVKLYVQPSSSGAMNVVAFGATEGGVIDNLSIFETADTAARALTAYTYIPSGVWAINGEWQLDTNSIVKGVVGKSEVKQISSTMADNVITTVENTRTDNANTVSNVHVEGIVVNGDYTRNSPPYSGVPASGGCGISFANVVDGSIRDCHAIDCTKHGIDITSAVWNVSGDDPTTRPSGGCQNIVVERCSATNFGDDGITTHYSQDLDIRDCNCYDSGDFYSVGNSNGLEIDDGSNDVRVFGGRYDRNTRGVQIKGHDYAPAAERVRLFGVTCENNSQNFVLLHDGFSSGPVSITAYDVELHGCVSIVPRQKNASGLDRRALAISQYGGVLVNGFTIVGVNDAMPSSDPSYTTDPSSTNMIAIFGNARDVVLDSLRFRYVEEADTLIQINNTAKDISILNASYEECLGLPINVDSGTEGVVIKGVRAHTTQTPTPAVVIDFTNSPAGADYTIEDVRYSGYTDAYELSIETYNLPFEIKRGVVYASGSANPEGTYAAPRGSLYSRDDGGNSGLYVKESGDTGNTGWVLK